METTSEDTNARLSRLVHAGQLKPIFRAFAAVIERESPDPMLSAIVHNLDYSKLSATDTSTLETLVLLAARKLTPQKFEVLGARLRAESAF